MTEFVRLDLFPATAVVGDTTYTPARVIVTDDTVYVFMDQPSGPAVVFESRLDDFYADGKEYVAVLADGENMRISSRKGCGCGSRLRSMRAFPGVRRVAKTS